MVGRPDAGTHEDRRASVGAGGQHDQVRADQRAIVELDRRRAARFEHDRRDHGVGPDDQVRRAVAIGQIGIGGRDAHAVPGAHRHRPGADRTRLVVILDPRDAHRVERLERGRMDLRRLETRIARDRDRTPIAVPGLSPNSASASMRRNAGRTSAKLQPGFPRAAQASKSAAAPRTANRVSHDVPPRTRPRRSLEVVPAAFGSDSKPQSGTTGRRHPSAASAGVGRSHGRAGLEQDDRPVRSRSEAARRPRSPPRRRRRPRCRTSRS